MAAQTGEFSSILSWTVVDQKTEKHRMLLNVFSSTRKVPQHLRTLAASRNSDVERRSVGRSGEKIRLYVNTNVCENNEVRTRQREKNLIA